MGIVGVPGGTMRMFSSCCLCNFNEIKSNPRAWRGRMGRRKKSLTRENNIEQVLYVKEKIDHRKEVMFKTTPDSASGGEHTRFQVRSPISS